MVPHLIGGLRSKIKRLNDYLNFYQGLREAFPAKTHEDRSPTHPNASNYVRINLHSTRPKGRRKALPEYLTPPSQAMPNSNYFIESNKLMDHA